MSEAVRVAMWSGPRNISTAMMRAWENRLDTVAIDEPLYAYYLEQTGLDHPARDEVLKAQSRDAGEVTQMLTGPIPGGKPIWYQKHMTQHILPQMSLDWLGGLRHCFLIRAPEAVVASFTIQRPDADASELGFAQQWRVFEQVRERTGTVPPVVDSADVLRQPEVMLRAICTQLGVPFSERMLQWPAGPRASDGVWAPHWYARVERSTGFAPWRPRDVSLSKFQQRLVEHCRPYYERMAAHRLLPAAAGRSA